MSGRAHWLAFPLVVVVVVVVVVVALVVVVGCSRPVLETVHPASSSTPKPAAQPVAPTVSPASPPPSPPPPVRARVLAVGDLLMHLMLVDAARQKDGSWDFSSIFADTKPWVASADVAIANLETNFAGSAYPLAGYPVFNTPDAFAGAIRDAGFDVVTLANNHILDHREAGVRRTIDVLDAAGLAHTGAAVSAAARDDIVVVEPVPGLRLALLAYTYGSNNPHIPYEHTVNLIDPARMRADVERARVGARADAVFVALHAGAEYTPTANADQRRAIDAAVDAGADVVLGGHPHVIHHAWFADGRAGIASLGNFVSAQPGRATQESVLFVVDVEKDEHGTRVVDAGVVPIYTHLPGSLQRTAVVVPVEATLAAAADNPRAASLRARLTGVLEDLDQRLASTTVRRLPPVPPTPIVAAQPKIERVAAPLTSGTGLWLAGVVDDVALQVDGVETPLPVAGHRVVALPAGTHSVVAHRDGFLDVFRVVAVVAGRVVEVPLPHVAVNEAGLVARAVTGTATLAVDGPAGAVVVVDGKPLGTAPNAFVLPAGKHRLEVQSRNAVADVRTILLFPRRATTVTANPLPLLASPTVVTADASPGTAPGPSATGP
jgi:poly-gamma-glutamate synthesis protein (capsule biosynthesis protein)